MTAEKEPELDADKEDKKGIENTQTFILQLRLFLKIPRSRIVNGSWP